MSLMARTLMIIPSPKPVKAGKFINAYGQIGDLENRSMDLPLIGQNQIRGLSISTRV